ncbi:MAG: M28 family peptidase [Candidatus Thorarchaeota archaeon]
MQGAIQILRSRRRIFAIIAVVGMIIAGYAIITYLSVDGPDGTAPQREIIPHPYNNLNWWDLPRKLTEATNIANHLSQIDLYPYRSMVYQPAGYFAAAEYISSKLESFGIDSWLEGSYDSLVGLQKGFGNDERALVFGAYLDTEPGSTLTILQNGGGCALIVMLAEILSQFRLPIDIYYVFYSYSKAGDYAPNGDLLPFLYGSKEMAQYFIDEGIEVMAVYNFEEVMLSRTGFEAQYESLSQPGYYRSEFLCDLLDTAFRQNGENLLSISPRGQTINDQKSFIDLGLPTINIRGAEELNPLDPPTDSISSSDYSMENVRKLTLAIASLAIFLANSGNGEPIRSRFAANLTSMTSASYWNMMSTSQLIELHLLQNSSQPLEFTLRSDSEVIETLTSSETNTTLFFTEMSGVQLVRIGVRNTGNFTSQVKIELEYEFDFDGDGTLDSEEYTWSEPEPPLDWDLDGLSDSLEKSAGTDIFVADTDLDSMPDGYEYRFGLNPLVDDSLEDLDDDGLANIREYGLGTYPNSTDTDQDVMDDFWEITYHTNPMVNDAQLDFDNDNLTNIQEYTYKSDPMSADGDFDGISDPDEIAIGTNPLNEDSDEDGLRDQLELIEGLNPLVPDYDVDLSPDGPDRNPRINSLLVILGLALIPVALGTAYFAKKIR